MVHIDNRKRRRIHTAIICRLHINRRSCRRYKRSHRHTATYRVVPHRQLPTIFISWLAWRRRPPSDGLTSFVWRWCSRRGSESQLARRQMSLLQWTTVHLWECGCICASVLDNGNKNNSLLFIKREKCYIFWKFSIFFRIKFYFPQKRLYLTKYTKTNRFNRKYVCLNNFIWNKGVWVWKHKRYLKILFF